MNNEDKMVPAGEIKPKRKPGWKYNAPAKRGGFGESEQDKVLVRRLMSETVQSWKKPRVKTDEELEQRLIEFWDDCVEQGKIPTIEEMVLSTGYSTGGFYDILNGSRPGMSPRTREIFLRAKEIIKAFDAKLALTGELNPVLYFFRAKNYYDMRDQQEVTLTTNAPDDRQMSKDEIEQWFLEDGKTITTGFTDEPEGGK